MPLRKLVTVALGAVLPLTVLVPTASAETTPPPAASPSRSQCSGDRYFYKKHDDKKKFKRAKGSYSAVSGDAGVTLTISKTRTFTVGGSISATQNVSVDAVVATLSASVGETVSLTYSDQSSVSGSWKVPSSYKKGGRLEIGANVHSGYVTKYRERKDCSIYTYSNPATYKNLPENNWHFHHVKL